MSNKFLTLLALCIFSSSAFAGTNLYKGKRDFFQEGLDVEHKIKYYGSTEIPEGLGLDEEDAQALAESLKQSVHYSPTEQGIDQLKNLFAFHQGVFNFIYGALSESHFWSFRSYDANAYKIAKETVDFFVSKYGHLNLGQDDLQNFVKAYNAAIADNAEKANAISFARDRIARSLEMKTTSGSNSSVGADASDKRSLKLRLELIRSEIDDLLKSISN